MTFRDKKQLSDRSDYYCVHCVQCGEKINTETIMYQILGLAPSSGYYKAGGIHSTLCMSGLVPRHAQAASVSGGTELDNPKVVKFK